MLDNWGVNFFVSWPITLLIDSINIKKCPILRCIFSTLPLFQGTVHTQTQRFPSFFDDDGDDDDHEHDDDDFDDDVDDDEDVEKLTVLSIQKYGLSGKKNQD